MHFVIYTQRAQVHSLSLLRLLHLALCWSLAGWLAGWVFGEGDLLLLSICFTYLCYNIYKNHLEIRSNRRKYINA